MKPIAIIPARGGSRRLKNKNIKFFYGRPILQRTIETIKKSKIFSKIILSSDSKKIINISKKLKVDSVIVRQGYLASNEAKTIEVIKDVIKKIEYKNYDFVCCVYPCNPLLSIINLKKTFKLIKKKNKKFIFPISEYPHPIERAFVLNKDNEIKFLKKKNADLNTQNFKKKYHDSGQFYWGSTLTWIKEHSIHNNSIGYIVPRYKTVDIDTSEDWEMAKILFKGLKT